MEHLDDYPTHFYLIELYMDREYHKNIAIYTSGSCIVIWIILLIISQNKKYHNSFNYFNIIIYSLPIFFIVYHVTIKHKAISDPTYDEDKIKKVILEEMEDKQLANVIPPIVFGVGILLNATSLKKYISRATIPYLLLSLLLGTIIPYIIMYNTFEETNLTKLLISEIVLFSSESFAFSLLLSCVLIPFFILSRSD